MASGVTVDGVSGETNLNTLLNGLCPRMLDEDYVFCSIKNGKYGVLAEAHPLATFSEVEGLTVVISLKSADAHGLSYQEVFRCITLDVHSSLNAVGLTAAVSTVLAERNISANMIAGYYHDHVFVPTRDAETALDILTEMSH